MLVEIGRSKVSVFEPNSRNLREALIFCFHLKKTAAEAHRMLSSTCGQAALSERTCREWFQRFKRCDFDVDDRHGDEKEKIFEDSELQALLDEDSCQMQENLSESLRVTQQAILKRLKAMRMIQTQGNWVLYKLKTRDVAQRFFGCEQLLLLQRQNRKGFYTPHCDWGQKMGPLRRSQAQKIIRNARTCLHAPRQRRDRIFTVPRLCSAFGGTSFVWCIMTC